MARNLLQAGFSVHAWNRSPGRAQPLADDGGQVFDDVSLRLALARKDGDLLLAAAEDVGLELPIMQAAVQRMRTIEDEHGDEDMAATYWASAPEAQRQ